MNEQTHLEWRSCGLTTVGTVREHNEDAYLTLPEQQLWLVADGMGGHRKGDLASKSIVDAFQEFQPRKTLSTTISEIEQCLLEVNNELYMQSEGRQDQIMGSTVALMHVYKQHIFYVWAGDSRIYRYRNKQLKQVSHDHSFVQEIVDKGMMSVNDATNHPSANIITRAIGVSDRLVLDIDHDIAEPGDKFLICSDGLFKDITLAEISKRMDDIPFKAAEALIDLSLVKQANDNVTVIIIEAVDKGAKK